ncbi:winged helix-turn-helix domain-containing protein [Pseudoalteromonas sp. R3]|uniref:winged helix-turn-helix domain-containing protein n=1 Tax=Pseudoalteromonas sp. R3 TaxID=1709477 RepID=UPI0006B5EB0E|nr:winged helix-turn-helix domain-containing protein [Pseudoalteromonas sp. R3]AZZ99957.1 transcriptional regulator [Pseudoalteromonas sp. R3]
MNEVNFSRTVKAVKFGSWTLDPKRQTITDGEVTRELEPLLFKILCYLILNNDQIITRDDLVNDVWCQNYVDNNAINRAMSELRKVLKSDKQKGLVVKTHYRKGYSFFLEPEIVYQDLIPQASVTPVAKPMSKQQVQQSVPETAFPTNKSDWFRPAFLVTLLLLIGGGLGVLHPLIENKPKAANSVSVPMENVLYKESLLSWMQGQYLKVSVSPNKEFVAFSFIPEGKTNQSLVMKNLQTGLEEKIAQPEANYYPLGWTVDSTKLFYRLNQGERCEIWQIDRSFSQDNRFLFECTNQVYNGAGVGDNTFIYSKFDYRGRNQLSVLMSYNTESGEEFQITSPNLNSFGDQFLLYEQTIDKVFFTRRRYDIYELYMTDLEGGNQTKLYESKTPIWALGYEEHTSTLVWFCNITSRMFEYSLASEQLTGITQLVNDSRFASHHPLSKGEIVAVSYPYQHDIYELSLENKTLSPLVVNDDLKFSGFSKNGETLFLKQQREKMILQAAAASGLPYNIGIPLGDYVSATYDHKSELLMLQAKNKLSIFDSDFNLINHIDVEGVVISAEFLNNGDIGYISVDESLKTNKVYIYSRQTQQAKKLPISDAIWFDQLGESQLVYLSRKDSLHYFDLSNGELTSSIELPGNGRGHFVSLGKNRVYYSNGRQVYQIQEGDIEELMDLELKTVFDMYYSFDKHSLIMTTVDESSNHLLKLEVARPAQN